MTKIAFIERVICGDDSRSWRERWEPVIADGPSPTMFLMMRDPKTGDIVSRHAFWLKSREQVIG